MIDIVSAPVSSFIDLSYVKDEVIRSYAGVSEDGFLQQCIDASIQTIQNQTHLLFGTYTLDEFFVNFPQYLKFSPVSSITSIKYLDVDDVEQTLNTDVYRESLHKNPIKISLKENQHYPTLSNRNDERVTVRYVAGYSSSTDANFPKDLLQCVYFFISHFYDTRTAVALGPGMAGVDVPKTVDFLIRQYKVWHF